MAIDKKTEQEQIADNLWKSKDWKDTRKILEKIEARKLDKKIEKIKV